ncbi:PAS domain S-box protein [Saccharibacillus sp. O23]|uniref:putative bifunctional diguanylate cyclase/phosphodiesterase n=1 Tax=Saccharibacillus sp. O23 TaxID=2009338 RepID=UPI000B4E1A14|nr:EAL domain-containing protein [Saccharibacillus sp. O23]OWR31148.1 PAS domain S-box protein [Saccharibacillus sp. O23]
MFLLQEPILFNPYFAAAGLLCSILACLMIPLLTSGGIRSLHELISPRRLYRLLFMGLCFGGTVLFGIQAALPEQFFTYELLYLLLPAAAGLLLSLIALRLTRDGGGWRGGVHFVSSAGLLTLLIIGLYYANVYFLFGSVNLQTEVLLLSGIGLFSTLFSLLRLTLLVSRRTGRLRLFERFPLIGLLFASTAASSIPFVITLAAIPPEIDTLFDGSQDRFAPYILLIVIAVGLMILTDRYREEDAEKRYRELHEKEMHYMSLFAHNPDAVFALDDGGRIVDMNAHAREMLSRLPEGADLHMITEWTTGEQQDLILQHYSKVMEGRADETELTVQIEGRNPVHLILTSLPILIEGRFAGAYSIAKNITDSKKNQDQILHLAYHDELTGLTNRKYAFEHVDGLTKTKAALPFHLFFIDFDRFKKINDLFGHEFGDKVIHFSAQKLQQALPEGTLLSRSNADGFIAVLPPGLDPLYAAQRVGDEFSLPFRVGQQAISLTVSVGISRFPEDGRDADTLFKHADLARFDAKSRGGARFAFFDHERAIENNERLILERDLQIAIEHGELMLYYQPKIDLRTGSLVGLEALVRWRHPDLGIVPPLKFIPIAEESGLIVPLERWVLRTACRQTKHWLNEGHSPVPVAVNISQIHLIQSDIVEHVLSALEDLELDSSLLELEVTESAMMHNEEQVIEILSRFQQAGISISLDDFGTGYSSLSYLHLLPIDCLKIDRSFIKGITTNENSRAIVEMILTMARQLDLRIVAEGIEYAEQAELLRELQCFTAQGFYYGKPVSASEIFPFEETDRRFAL